MNTLNKVISCFLFFIIFTGSLCANDSMKVLILNSWSPDQYWAQGEVKGIKDALKARYNKIQFTTEYMAHPRVKGINKEKYIQSFHQFFNFKYIDKREKFDIIFVTDDPALDYMLKYHDLYFPDIPVVFSGINNYNPTKMIDKKNLFFGVLETVDYLGTLDIAHKLHPQAKRFYILGDQTSTSQGQIAEIRKISSSFPIEFIYLDNLSFEQLSKKLRTLTNNDVLFLLALYSDSTGKQLSSQEISDFLESNVKVPLYSFWKGQLGRGNVIGGKLLSAYDHGQDAVEKFYMIDKEKRSLVQGGNNPFIFDYNQLNRFNIDLKKLPPNTQIINVPFSFYETYKTLVNGTMVFIGLLLISLSFLLLSIRKRKLIEKKLKNAKKKLELFSRDLEHEVEIRTQELVESNDELEHLITNLKNTQKKLIESEKMASLGSLVAGVAHEINTPVGIGLTGSSHFLYITEEIEEKYKMEDMSQEDFDEYLKRSKELATSINFNLDRAVNVVNSFKQVVVDQTTELKRVFNVLEYIRGILMSIDNTTKNKNINIEVNCKKDVNIKSYPGLFAQIITNLVINSVRHGFKNKESGNIVIDVKVEDNSLKLLYKDDGNGIPKKNLIKIYEPFFTTNRKDGGTGLGLNIIYNIITVNLKGNIDCKSEEGDGSFFTIVFPLD